MHISSIRQQLAAVLLFGTLWIGPVARGEVVAAFKTGELTLEIDSRGHVSGIVRNRDGRNYAAPGQASPLLSLRVEGRDRLPQSAGWNPDAGQLVLRYGDGMESVLAVSTHPTHVRFELKEIRPAGAADWVFWGPVSTSIKKTVGEVVGVVRDGEFAIGMQALNIQTQPGTPESEEGVSDRPYVASTTAWGSELRAFALDRTKPRKISVWTKRAPNMPVAPLAGETVLGTRIALFGCEESRALETIGKIEVQEGLPHPLIRGVWAKVSPDMGRSYMIADFSEADVDEVLTHVNRSGLMSLYHGNPWKSWGHFEPSPRYFPGGMEGLRTCATKARKLGIRLGVHTLSNFIQTHDPYVTPVPDPRLVRTGASPLTADVDAVATEMEVESPEYFVQQDRNEMRTVMIGRELVRYRSVSSAAPWRLLDCQRGAFGTVASAHRKGEEVGKLMDHAYKVFFPNLEMQREMVLKLAARFNEAGLSHMDFDGHEGCLATGQGNYGKDLFALDFFNAISGKEAVINGTSPPLSHFYWHMNSYCNWGEPWYGGFRDSMQEYRINNQAFFERNYIPRMLGWYLMKAETTLSDMEWMLARAAGYDAGFALATSPAALRKNPETGRVMDALREWEDARRSGSFTTLLRERMRDPKAEFHLERESENGWTLISYHEMGPFEHEQLIRQPGEPTSVRWDVRNPNGSQAMQFKLKVVGGPGSISNPVFEVDQSLQLKVPVEVQSGQTLLLEGDGQARVYDGKGNLVRSVPVGAKIPKLGPGANRVDFDCEFQGAQPPKIQVLFKTADTGTQVTRRK